MPLWTRPATWRSTSWSFSSPSRLGGLSDWLGAIQEWNGGLYYVRPPHIGVSLAEYVLISDQQAGQFGKLVVCFTNLARLFQQGSDMGGGHRVTCSEQAPGSTLLA